MNVFDLQAVLTLDSSEYDKALSSSEKSASSWSSGLKKGAAVAGAAFVAAGAATIKGVSDVAKYGDEIDKTSQKLGLSTDAYQKWDYVLNIAGTEMSSMTTGLKTLTNKLDDAKNGSSSAQEMFGKLGLSMDDLADMSREDIFEATVRSLTDMEDSTERAALANDLFGKSGQNLAPLFNMTNEEIDELMNNTEELGMIMSEDAVKASAAYQDAMTTLKGTLGGVRNSVFSKLLPAFTAAVDGATALAGGAKKAFQEGGIISAVEYVGTTIYDTLTGKLSAAADFLVQKFPALEGFFEDVKGLWETAKDTIGSVMELIKTLITVALDSIKKFWDKWGSTILSVVKTVWNTIKTVIQNALNIIKGIITVVTAVLSGDWKKAWEGIKSIASNTWEAIKTIITNAINIVKTTITNVFNNIKANVSTIFNSIKATISSIWDGIKTKVSSVVDSIKTKISSVFNAIKSTASSVWNGIKTAITNPIESAKNTISNIMSKIKGMFPLSIGRIFSNLTLPHISVSAGSPPFGIGGKGTKPSFSVEWYKKAYQNAYEFDYPTILPAVGFGDGVGSEMVIGKNYLMETLGDAVESRVGNLEGVMKNILAYLNLYFPQFASMELTVNGSALAGAIATDMDRALGNIEARKRRG